MRSKKILFILIPLIILVLVLGGAFAYLMLKSTPEKIFTISINKVFDALKTEEEEMTTLKGKVTLTGSIESDNEEVQAINDVLETSSATVNMAIDTENMIVNENIEYIYDDESVLNASILLQDEKGYIYLPEILDKYLEIPEDELDFSQFEEMFNNSKSLDKNLILSSIQDEVINVISKQEFKQEKNGKIKASILELSQEQFYNMYGEVVRNLKQNENFNKGLGEYKEDVIASIDDMLEDFSNFEAEGETRAVISIYTEGLFNKFRGFGIELKTEEDVEAGYLFIVSEQIYEFSMYSTYDGEKEEIFKVKVEDKKEDKNKGTATITLSADEEEYIIVYKYENKENQTNFKATTEIEGVMLEILGNTLKDGNNYKGELGLVIEQEEGTINVKVDYNFEYNVEISKTNIDESVLIDELTEEDQEEMMSNIENASFLGIGAALTMGINEGLFEKAEQAAQATQDALKQEEQLLGWQSPIISGYGYMLMYTIPENFELSSDSTILNKIYTDNEYNMVTLTIEPSNIDSYLKDLENSSILTSDVYKKQELGEITDYEANGKLYKYRTIAYSKEDVSFINLYFAYEVEDGYTYVVKVESEGGQIDLEDINMFLDTSIEMSSMQEYNELANGKILYNGEWIDVEDLTNIL